MNQITLYLGDCLEKMALIPDGSVDMVMADLPYGTTACKWDSVIPFEPLWAAYRRVCKKNAAIVLTASQPFTSALVTSNMREFKYCWVWDKGFPTGFLNANYRPLIATEDICVFSDASAGAGVKGGCNPPMPYYPQELKPVNLVKKNKAESRGQHLHQEVNCGKNNCLNSDKIYVQKFTGYPTNILKFRRDTPQTHPTQKPVALMEYLIRTYTKPGEVVLDNTMGSGTTGVACVNTGRKFIGIERDEKYFEIAEERILFGV